MKKVTAFIGIAAMAVTLAACTGQKQESASASSAASSAASSSAASSASSEEVVGGWTLPESVAGTMSNEALEAFNKAIESGGEQLFAVHQLGSQVVSGTNYMLLCTDTDRTQWKVAVVYEDLSGNAEISGVTDLDLGKYARDDTGAAGEQDLSGGWTVFTDPSGEAAELPQDVAAAFNGAMEGLAGADYMPVLYMGSQVVNGSNYAILCEQTLVTANPVTNLALVYIYAPAAGDPEILNIYPLNLADFNG